MTSSPHVMRWFKVLFPIDEVQQFAELNEVACQRRSKIADFALFTGYEFSDDGETCYHAIYFSPTAALECEDLIALSFGVECAPPDPDPEDDFGFSCGDQTVLGRFEGP